jgi:hypothetical protein
LVINNKYELVDVLGYGDKSMSKEELRDLNESIEMIIKRDNRFI